MFVCLSSPSACDNYAICVCDLHGYWLKHLLVLFRQTTVPLLCCGPGTLFMAVKIGSVLVVKMKRAQDRKVVMDKAIQKKRLSLEALERGFAVASIAPVMAGTDKGVGMGRKASCTGRKQNRTGRKQERSRRKDVRIRTGRKQDRLGRNQTGRKKQDRSGRRDIRIGTGRKRDQIVLKRDRLVGITAHASLNLNLAGSRAPIGCVP